MTSAAVNTKVTVQFQTIIVLLTHDAGNVTEKSLFPKHMKKKKNYVNPDVDVA